MKRTCLHLGRITALVLILCHSLAAGIFISVSATGSGGTSSESDSSDDNLGSATSAHGQAIQYLAGNGNSFVLPNSGSSCAIGLTLVANASAHGCAAVNANIGLLRAASHAEANDGSEAFGLAAIDDTISFAVSPTFNIHLDFDYSGLGPGYTHISFGILLVTGDEGNPYSCLYCFDFTNLPSPQWQIIKADTFIPTITTGTSPLTTLDDSLTFPLISDLNVRFRLFTESSCYSDENLPCSAWTDAQKTAYVGISTPYTSSNGYTYLGFQPTAGVPEPATLPLYLAGMAALLALRRRL